MSPSGSSLNEPITSDVPGTWRVGQIVACVQFIALNEPDEVLAARVVPENGPLVVEINANANW
jgi:hypothetical protein